MKRKSRSKRVLDLARVLSEERIAWMWSCDLPQNYSQLSRRPWWLQDCKAATPCILRGARVVRDDTTQSRAYAAQRFCDRAARMLKLTTEGDCWYLESNQTRALHDRIMQRVGQRWPMVRSAGVRLEEGERWLNGLLVRADPYLDKATEECGRINVFEAQWRKNAIIRIANALREIERIEALDNPRPCAL